MNKNKNESETITRLFFKVRFPEKDIDFEKRCGYFQTWEKRLMSNNPSVFMDNQSKAAWMVVQNELVSALISEDMD